LSYFIYLLKIYMWYFFQIKLFKWCVINVWVIIHIDTHFLKLEYLNYDNVKPFKSKFFLFQIFLCLCIFIFFTLTSRITMDEKREKVLTSLAMYWCLHMMVSFVFIKFLCFLCLMHTLKWWQNERNKCLLFVMCKV
jgi:hypothetical protein